MLRRKERRKCGMKKCDAVDLPIMKKGIRDAFGSNSKHINLRVEVEERKIKCMRDKVVGKR